MDSHEHSGTNSSITWIGTSWNHVEAISTAPMRHLWHDYLKRPAQMRGPLREVLYCTMAVTTVNSGMAKIAATRDNSNYNNLNTQSSIAELLNQMRERTTVYALTEASNYTTCNDDVCRTTVEASYVTTRRSHAYCIHQHAYANIQTLLHCARRHVGLCACTVLISTAHCHSGTLPTCHSGTHHNHYCCYCTPD